MMPDDQSLKPKGVYMAAGLRSRRPLYSETTSDGLFSLRDFPDPKPLFFSLSRSEGSLSRFFTLQPFHFRFFLRFFFFSRRWSLTTVRGERFDVVRPQGSI
jgi:hypothetical protein